MSIDIGRRGFLGACAAGAASLSVRRAGGCCSDPAPGMYFDWERTPVAHVRVARAATGTVVLVLGASGAKGQCVLIDACPAALGPQLRRECESMGNKVGLVVSTHHHPEITGGLRAFTTDTRVVGHAREAARVRGQMHRYISQVKEFLFRAGDKADEATRRAIEKDWHALHAKIGALEAPEFSPTEPLDKPEKEYVVDGRRVLVFEVPAAIAPSVGAHTDTDVGVYLPDDDVLIAGGLLAYGRHAVLDRDAGGSCDGWLAALEVLERKCTPRTLVIPGEGEVSAIATNGAASKGAAGATSKGGVDGRSMIAWQRSYLSALRGVVVEAVAKGATRQQVRALRPTLGVAPGDASESRLLLTLDSAYDEFVAARTPNATPELKK